MKNKRTNSTREQFMELDNQLFLGLKELGLVSYQADLSRLLRKNPSYVGCMRHKKYGIPVGTLAAATAMESLMLSKLPHSDETSQKWLPALKLLRQIIDAKCLIQRQEFVPFTVSGTQMGLTPKNNQDVTK